MSSFVWVVRGSGLGAGLGMLARLGAQLGSQQVARRNAAMAAAALLRHREEREAVEAYVAARLDAPSGSAGPTVRPVAGAGTAS